MIIINFKFTAAIFLILSIFTQYLIVTAELRPLNGQSNKKDDPNAGTPQSPFVREIQSTSWPDEVGKVMVSTPGEYTENLPKTNLACTNPLPNGQFPLLRCVSNLINGLQAKLGDEFNIKALESKKSKRKTSHMLTFWGQFANLDVINTASIGENLAIAIPSDDANYNSVYSIGPSNPALTAKSLPFNRTAGPNRSGINQITSFLDGSLIYGVTDEQVARVRDKEGGRGKFKLRYFDTEDGKFGYPLVDDIGEYMFGTVDHKGKNLFMDTIMLILMREHNSRCDDLFQKNKNKMTDEDYFQEARRWVIAIIQRITYLEYLSAVLGTPLKTAYLYNPSLTPSIDTFYSTVSARYGHSEMSDVYNMVNKEGYKIAELPLNSIQTHFLIENYGVPTIVLSMALQRQEEIDIFYADQMRAFLSKAKTIDIASLDLVRGRDRGMPLYNDAREAFGFKRVAQFTEISSDPEVQKRLQLAYKDVNQVESLIGGLAEDHEDGSILGRLFHTSFTKQWTLIRDSDRLWFEGKDAGFSFDEINDIRNITWLSVIQRNTPTEVIYPTNLWSVQPTSTLNSTTVDKVDDYPPQNFIKISEVYEVRWVIKGDQINFKLTMLSTNSWFGLGFNPSDTGMIGADMIIIWNKKNDTTLSVKNYVSNGYEKPQEDVNNQYVTIKNQSTTDGITRLEISRPLKVPNKRPITNEMITMIYAWNPNSMELSYHQGNRGATKVNFFSGETSSDVVQSQNLTRLIHGIAMYIVWCILFPASIFIVRYLKHIDSYMSQHRNLQMLGSLIVITFGAASMATVPQHGRTPHGALGLTIYFTLLIQIGLGLLAIWGLASVESASTGIVVGLKHFHFYLGVGIMILSWCQIYLGIQTYLGLQTYGPTRVVTVLYLCWLAILVLMIVASEYVYKFKNMQFLWPIRETDEKNKRLHNCIPEDVYEQLPAITWNDFNLKVMAGAHLVVAEGLVFDIHKWIKIHPGGQRILRRVIGTDVTQDFFFDPTDQIVINRAFSESEKLMKSMEEKEVNTKKLKSRKPGVRPKSIANAVDLINSTTFKNSRVAMHRHSKFATAKLATMVIARISDMPNEKRDDNFNISPGLPTTPQDNSYIFRRYILTNIELASRHDAENLVKKLTFQVIHPKDKLPNFLPGDYIEIMSYVNKHVVIRPYTPLQGPSDKTFTILVKIYKDGVMSQHLDKQLRNFEIAVRGPFDIADRMYVPPSSTQGSTFQLATSPTSPIIRPTSPSPNLTRKTTLVRNNSVSVSIGNYQPSHFGLDSAYGDESRSVFGGNSTNNTIGISSRILLNPARDDQCWDVLFMVCGGTGLTPMLQLIQYHFDCADNFKSNFKLHLLCANTQISDIISMKYLDFLASTSDGKLTVTHILTKSPPIWKGLTGHVDDNILFNWVSKNYQIPPPAIPPRVNLSSQSQNPSSPTRMLLTSTYNPQIESMYNYPTSPPDSDYGLQMRSNIPSLLYNNNEISVMSERQDFMRMFSQDTTQACKVIVCGPYGMMEGVRRSLERIGFPVDTKASFIQ